jgi:ribosomal protein S16
LRKKLTIKLFKVRANSPNVHTKMIVVGFNNKVNGSYVERLGVFYKEHDTCFILLNIPRFSYWLLRNVKIKSRVSWMLGLLAHGEQKGDDDNIK